MSSITTKSTQKRTRSRFGCHSCKRQKIKCDERRPSCSSCSKTGKKCDYTIQLTWGGRPFKKRTAKNSGSHTITSFEKKLKTNQQSHPPNTITTSDVHSIPEISDSTNSLSIDDNSSDFFESVINRNEIDVNDPLDLDFSTDHLIHQEHTIIPYNLLPIPDLLLQEPLFRENYYSFTEIFSKLLVPAPPSAYIDNPFVCILPRMSLSSSTDGLLRILITFGALQNCRIRQTDPQQDLLDGVLAPAFNDLYTRLSDPLKAQDDITLAMILALSCLDVNRAETYDWRAHLLGAKKIMLSRGLIKFKNNHFTFDLGSESDIPFFFTRWFAYEDVIGALCSSSIVSERAKYQKCMVWDPPEPSEMDKLRLKDIDPFMGFDLRFLRFFANIIALVRERESNYPTFGTLSPELIQLTLETKEDITNFFELTEMGRDQVVSKIKKDPLNPLNDALPAYGILRATNRVFVLSGILQIYRRILRMPSDAVLVQGVVEEVTNILRFEIPKSSPAACCTLFSLFTCGCEALESDIRNFYKERFSVLAANGISAAPKALELLIEVWESGKYWADLIAEKNLDVVFM